MAKPRLGKLEAVEVVECWPDEARDFTPWLAEEGLAMLGEALNLELEVEGTEVPVGRFSADIVARDTAGNSRVVIENQYGRSDHDHLGKAMTYAAVLDARTVVWVAPRFTEEHRKAIEWLNEHTDDNLELYALELRAFRIGGSEPAPQFEVVAGPNETVRDASTAIEAAASSERRQAQHDFWKAVSANLKEAGRIGSLRAPRPRYWYDVALGRTNVWLSLFADTWGKRVGVRVVLAAPVAAAALPQLEAQKVAIEREVGMPLVWNPHPEKAVKTIVGERAGDILEGAERSELVEWISRLAEKMREAFAPRVRQLDLARESAEEA
jgi:hypothetical protein